MQKFWKKGVQAEQSSTTAVSAPGVVFSPQLLQNGVSKKVVHSSSCWGGSGASGEGEVVSSPSGSPTADKIKAMAAGAQHLDNTQRQAPATQQGVHAKVPATSSVSTLEKITNKVFGNTPATPAASKPASPSWNPFAKEKTLPSSSLTKQQQPASAMGTSTYFSATPILGVAPSAAAQRDVTVEEHVTKFAGRMGNIVANSMAGGFGATLGRRAAHSVWNGMTGRR